MRGKKLKKKINDTVKVLLQESFNLYGEHTVQDIKDDIDWLKDKVHDQQRMIEILLSHNNMVICPQCYGRTYMKINKRKQVTRQNCLLCGARGIVEISLEKDISPDGEKGDKNEKL